MISFTSSFIEITKEFIYARKKFFSLVLVGSLSSSGCVAPTLRTVKYTSNSGQGTVHMFSDMKPVCGVAEINFLQGPADIYKYQNDDGTWIYDKYKQFTNKLFLNFLIFNNGKEVNVNKGINALLNQKILNNVGESVLHGYPEGIRVIGSTSGIEGTFDVPELIWTYNPKTWNLTANTIFDLPERKRMLVVNQELSIDASDPSKHAMAIVCIKSFHWGDGSQLVAQVEAVVSNQPVPRGFPNFNFIKVDPNFREITELQITD